MKKKLFPCIVLILSLFLVGCEKVIDLTDEESKQIAEYAGGLLLKYDRNIDSKYEKGLFEAEVEALNSTEAVIEISTENTATVTDASTEAEINNQEHVVTEEPVDAEDVSGVVSDVGADFNIAEFLGENNINIKYSYYMLLDTYPSYGKDGVYIELEAQSGYKLLVLKFELENKTNDNQYIDLYSKDTGYNIIINDSKIARQMLTILLDDMYTYQNTLEASSREEIVLIYQVSSELTNDIDDLKLKITYDGLDKVMQLQ
ncbi:MAG: hypothetical protein NC393_04660 [Clostridium sp.]|nr:hypothetical protein [Clostridium sp.]MCM1171403.1 hypothetical protein [Clostridium sp.]MCM1208167.1 hypothetical protein [Ruminococcus sp.]